MRYEKAAIHKVFCFFIILFGPKTSAQILKKQFLKVALSLKDRWIWSCLSIMVFFWVILYGTVFSVTNYVVLVKNASDWILAAAMLIYDICFLVPVVFGDDYIDADDAGKRFPKAHQCPYKTFVLYDADIMDNRQYASEYAIYLKVKSVLLCYKRI